MKHYETSMKYEQEYEIRFIIMNYSSRYTISDFVK